MAANEIPNWSLVLRSRREKLGRLSQEEVAARTGDLLAQRTVSHLEKGVVELGNLSVTRVVALAKALEWSLPELQQATGVDLGITEGVVSQDATPIYRIQDLTRPDPKPDSFTFLQSSGRQMPANYIVVYADSDEMTTHQARSIRSGDQVFIDTDDNKNLIENNLYAVVFKDRIHLRRYTKLPEGYIASGYAFTADNPDYAMQAIPVDKVNIIGRVFRFISDQFEQSKPVKN